MCTSILYRAFHDQFSSGSNSADGFLSGVCSCRYRDTPCGDQHDDSDTVREHFKDHNRAATPWISTTHNLLRAFKRAQKLSGDWGKTGVFIAVIKLAELHACHHYLAKDLEERLGIEPRIWHQDEHLIRFRIPKEAVLCCLSWETLEHRGLYTVLPEIQQGGTADEWGRRILAYWTEHRPEKHLTAVGEKAARFAFLFGEGEHTAHIGLEAAGWWEGWVGKVLKRAFYRQLKAVNDSPDCFETL